MNAGANRLSILYDLWIKSCTSLLWKSRLCLCEIQKRHLMNIVINLINVHNSSIEKKNGSLDHPSPINIHFLLRISDILMFLYSRKRRKIWRWEVEWVKEPIPEISPKHFHSPNLPQTSPPCQTSVKSWRVESRSWQLGWQPARRRWEQGERSWSLRFASFFRT